MYLYKILIQRICKGLSASHYIFSPDVSQLLKALLITFWLLHAEADILLWAEVLCCFILSPKTDADTQSRVWRRPAPSLISAHMQRFSPHGALRWQIINSTATEAQNHIHSDCHWLVLLAFHIYNDQIIKKFLSWCFLHKSKRKEATQSGGNCRSLWKKLFKVWKISF